MLGTVVCFSQNWSIPGLNELHESLMHTGLKNDEPASFTHAASELSIVKHVKGYAQGSSTDFVGSAAKDVCDCLSYIVLAVDVISISKAILGKME